MVNTAASIKGDESAWIDQSIAPPHNEDMGKLLGALGSVADASPFLTRVKQFVVDGPLRRELGISLYDETVWGVIRWRRALGRPGTSSLSAGFAILHQYDFSIDVSGAGPERTIGGWVPAGAPTLWDGPEDEETLAVSFMLHGVYKWKNRVIVGMAQGVEWHPVDEPWLTQRRRVITYPASLPKGEFDVPRGAAPIDLGVFEVVRSW
ncbi:MAG TPA: hypothetical protein VJM31_00075 [Vicinamibacterales bacterium]|nr:hypothetical protein [Vicinamibacterales bacterium]